MNNAELKNLMIPIIQFMLISLVFLIIYLIFSGILFIERNTFISSDEVLQFLHEVAVRKNETYLANYKNNINLSYNEKTIILTIDPIKKGWWKEKVALKFLSKLRLKTEEETKFAIKERLIHELNSYPSLYCYHGFDRKTIQCEFRPNFDLATSSKDTFSTCSELIQQTVPSVVVRESVKRLDDKGCSAFALTEYIDWMVYVDPLEHEEALKKLISLAQKKDISILVHFIVHNESKIDEVIEKYKNSDLLTDEEKSRLNKKAILQNNFIVFKYGIRRLPLVLTLTFNNETQIYKYKKCENCI